MVDQTKTGGQIDAYFEGKPESYTIFRTLHDRIAALCPSETTVGSGD